MDPPATPPPLTGSYPEAQMDGDQLETADQLSAQRLAFGRRSVGSRVSTACERCRRRKIRCDGQMPACRPCQRVKAACVFESRASPRPIVSVSSTDGELAQARLRIRRLEDELVRRRQQQQQQQQQLQPEDHSALADAPPIDSSLDASADGQVLGQGGQTIDSATYQQQSQSDPQLSTSHAAATADSHHDIHAPPLSNSNTNQPALAHEIGLVSLTPGSEARYIGPSSGFFFARKIMGSLNSNQARDTSHRKLADLRNLLESAVRKDVHTSSSSPTPLPATAELCKQLSTHYFRTIHIELPFMHEQQHMSTIDAVYNAPAAAPLATFQVNMVLAVAAADLSKRLKVSVNPVGYFSNAQRLLESFSTEGSLKGLQCLLLLVVYALHQPNTGLNAWYLHYETIASVLDLGLQRDVSRLALPLKEQEMRTRIFWVVYSLDRRLATMMGRPIGLRDEACELRLPLPASDAQLERLSSADELQSNLPTHMTWAAQLFKLAQINSEIKYVLHSISKESGHFSFAPVNNVQEWQYNMTHRLDAWAAEIRAIPDDPAADGASRRQTWLQRYREILILLQWPSPAVRVPCRSTMLSCYSNALESLSLLIDLYQSEQLIYSTTTIHSVFVAALTMLYCLSTNPDIVRTVPHPHQDVDKLYQSMNILTSLGEYWVECRRARDGLMQVARPIIQQFLQQTGSRSLNGSNGADGAIGADNAAHHSTASSSMPQSYDHMDTGMVFDDFLPAMDAFMNPDFFMAQFEGLGAMQDSLDSGLMDPLLDTA